jgi:hypothetical protein
MENELNIHTYRELFFYLKSAVIFLPQKYRQQVFQDMCAALEDRDGATPEVLRKLMDDFGYVHKEYCQECDKDVSGTIEVGKAICKECKDKLQPVEEKPEPDEGDCECGRATAVGPYCRPCYHDIYGYH